MATPLTAQEAYLAGRMDATRALNLLRRAGLSPESAEGIEELCNRLSHMWMARIATGELPDPLEGVNQAASVEARVN